MVEEGKMRSMDIGEMWSLTNREDNNWGIEGYEAPKKYNDAKKQIWDRKVYDDNMKVWSKKGHYDKKQQKVDKDGNPVIEKRPNYLDEVTKWANSFYDPKRAEEILAKKPEEPKEEKKPSKDPKLCKLYKSERMLYTDWLILYEKNKIKPRAEEIKDLEKIMEKINAKKLNEVEKMKEKYGSKKGSLPKADRLSLVHDAEYVGERIPFYSTPAGEEGGGGSEDEGKKQKKGKQLAFPSKKAIWHRDPAWSIKKPLPKNAEIAERIKEKDDARLENVTKKFEEKKIDLKGDVIRSFNAIDHWKRLNFTYNKPVKKSEQYDKWKEENPSKWPGPQQYFKTPIERFEKKKKKKGDDEGAAMEAEDDKKDFYSDRKKIDKRIYKPMKSHIF